MCEAFLCSFLTYAIPAADLEVDSEGILCLVITIMRYHLLKLYKLPFTNLKQYSYTLKMQMRIGRIAYDILLLRMKW